MLAGLAVFLLIAALLGGACGDDSQPAEEFTSEWPDDRPVPSATIEAVGSDDGVVITLELNNFVVSSPAAEDADGHLHIAVDGGATLMTHDTTVDLGPLEPGTHEVTVGFVANNHSTITADGAHLMSMTVVEVAPDGSVTAVRAAGQP